MPFSGRLDRLSLTDGGPIDRRLQTGRGAASRRRAHVAQLAVYRGALQPLSELPMRAALVYLDGPTLAPIGPAELDAALAEVVAAA